MPRDRRSTPIRVVREPILGIAAARLRAALTTSAESLLLVDDDAELLPDYVACALRVIAANPNLGCFGGKLQLPGDVAAPAWARSLLGFLAIRDAGDLPITACTTDWGEPPAAGAFVRRALLDHYRMLMERSRIASQLGRKGVRSVGAGEDALLMSGAYDLGLSAAYQPTLRVIHHVDPSRFEFGYLLRLMYGHGHSRILLERVLRDAGRRSATGPNVLLRVARSAIQTISHDARLSLRYACCTAAYRMGTAIARMKLIAASPRSDEGTGINDPPAPKGAS